MISSVKKIARTIVENGVIPTICRQCDLHCGIEVHIKDGVIVDINGLKNHPQNLGKICHKGYAAIDLVYHKDRLLTPLKKMKDGTFKEISLEQAMDEIAKKIKNIIDTYEPRSIGVWKGEAIGFAQQEEYARRFIHALGSPNYLSCDSQCFASRYIAYNLVQGFWVTQPDFAHANLIVLWGTNPPYTHPPFMHHIAEAKQRGSKIVVIDPRLTNIGYIADLYIRIKPGTDGALALGIAHYLIETDEYDHQFVESHTYGFEQFKQWVARFSLEYVTQQTGISKNTVIELAHLFASERPRISNYVGVSLEHQENGVNTVRAIVELTGLCGGTDAEGGDVWYEGIETKTLTLYEELPLADKKPIGADRFPVLYDFRKECHTMTAIDYMLGEGKYPLKGLILTAGNPANTNANVNKVKRGFSQLELLVVRDLFLTETAQLADYVIPAASFLERSEIHYYSHLQRIGLSRKVLDIPDVLDEYTFWRDLSHRLGFGEKYFPWKSEEEVNRWILSSTPITLEDLQKHPEGIEYLPIKHKKYRHNPFPTPSGKFEFTSLYLREHGYPDLPEYRPPLYMRRQSKKYPFTAITGARKYLFTHSRFRNIARFRTVHPHVEAEIHPEDASQFGVQNNDLIKITSEIGSVTIPARIVDENEILRGTIQVSHGWEEKDNINLITYDNINDPISGFSHLTSIPVRIEKAV